MKTKILSLLSSLLLIWGCTLSMEEYVIEPEEMGFDEAVSYEDENVKITYKFKDGVKPVTKNVYEYVVESDDPNYIYFMDNIPKKWLPKEGEFLSGACNPKVPDGLLDRVVSVTHQNGMYKVEITPATEDDVFEELEIEADFDYIRPKKKELTAITGDMTDEQKKNAATYDFSVVDGTNKDRAEDEEEEVYEDEDSEGYESPKRTNIMLGANDDVVDEDSLEKRDVVNFSMDTRLSGTGWVKVAKESMKEWLSSVGLKDASPYLAFSYVRKDQMHNYVYHNKITKVDSVYSDVTPTYDVKLQLGIDLDGKCPGTNDAGHFTDTKTLHNYMKTQEGLGKLGKNTSKLIQLAQPDQDGNVKITLCELPIACKFVIGVEVSPILTVGGSIGGHWKWVGETWRQGSVKIGDYKKAIKQKISDGKTLVCEFCANGYIKAGAEARVGVGFEIGHSVTLTAGLGAEAYIEAGYDNSEESEGPFLVGINTQEYFPTSNWYIKALVRAFIDLKVEVSPLNLFTLWSERMELATFPIFDKEKAIANKITIPSGAGSIVMASVPLIEEGKKEKIEYSYQYKIAELGNNLYNKKLVPMIFVYDTHKKLHCIEVADGYDKNSPQQLKVGTYNFNFTKEWTNVDIPYYLAYYECYFVPVLYNPDGDSYIYARLAKKVIPKKPILNGKGFKQTYGGPLPQSRAKIYGLKTNPLDFIDERPSYDDYNEYRYNFDFEIQNGELMSKAGCIFKLTDGVEHFEYIDEKVLMSNPKSGKYTFDISFVMNKDADIKGMGVVCSPMYYEAKDNTSYIYDTNPYVMSLKLGVNDNPGKSTYGEVKHKELK